jgi:hypothetical protein
MSSILLDPSLSVLALQARGRETVDLQEKEENFTIPYGASGGCSRSRTQPNTIMNTPQGDPRKLRSR